MTVKLIVLAITLFIYVLTIVAFNRARTKYKGGRGGDVINLILITVVLLFLADYVGLLDSYISDNVAFILQTLFRTAALSFLALGATRNRRSIVPNGFTGLLILQTTPSS